MARPPKLIDWDLVEEKMESGCSGLEICHDFRLDDNTFYSRFKQEYGKSFQDISGMFSLVGEGNIKHHQYKKALGRTKKGDTNILIHLGKVRLKQKDYDDKSTVPNDETLELKDQLTKALFRINELENALKPKTDPIVQ